MSLALAMNTASVPSPSQRSGRRRPRVLTMLPGAHVEARRLEELVRLPEHDELDASGISSGRRAAA